MKNMGMPNEAYAGLFILGILVLFVFFVINKLK